MADEHLNERKTFIKAVGMESTKFVNETLFLFLAVIICTSDGDDGTNSYVTNGVVGTVEMPGDRFVALIVYISRRCSARRKRR